VSESAPLPSVLTAGALPASRARLAAIDGGNDEKSGCVEGGIVDGDRVAGDFVVGTSPTGSGGGSPAAMPGPPLRSGGAEGGIEAGASCGCGDSGSTGPGCAEARSSASASGVTMLGCNPSSVGSGPGLGSDGLAKL